jgi:hypothetical protein
MRIRGITFTSHEVSPLKLMCSEGKGMSLSRLCVAFQKMSDSTAANTGNDDGNAASGAATLNPVDATPPTGEARALKQEMRSREGSAELYEQVSEDSSDPEPAEPASKAAKPSTTPLPLRKEKQRQVTTRASSKGHSTQKAHATGSQSGSRPKGSLKSKAKLPPSPLGKYRHLQSEPSFP